MEARTLWQHYSLAVTAICLSYYAVLGWKFYKYEISTLLRPAAHRKQRLEEPINTASDEFPNEPEDAADDSESTNPAWQNDEYLETAQNLLEHISEEIEEAHQKHYNKQDLVEMLQMILREYQNLRGTPFQFAINNRIEAECSKYGSIHLSEGDKREVWSMV